MFPFIPLRFVLIGAFMSALATGCAGMMDAGCERQMTRRGDMCEGFGAGTVWHRVPARGVI